LIFFRIANNLDILTTQIKLIKTPINITISKNRTFTTNLW